MYILNYICSLDMYAYIHTYICICIHTCNELIIVNSQAKISDPLSLSTSLAAKTRRPIIHVPQSNGSSARILQIIVLCNINIMNA